MKRVAIPVNHCLVKCAKTCFNSLDHITLKAGVFFVFFNFFKFSLFVFVK